MARRKNESPHFLARLLGASDSALMWILICGFLALLFFGTYFLWGRFGGHILAGKDFQVTSQSMEVTPQPEWIRHSDVASESILSGSLEGLSSRQTDLTVRVAQAFTMHPWIRRVKHVSKRYPAKVFVELEYRQPVAMVEVPGGRLPVDTEGVLLPTVDFTAEFANRFPRITAGETNPVSSIAGSQWGDERVHSAAKLAAFLLPYWQRLGLAKIVAYRGPRTVTTETPPYFVLLTKQGTNIIWGHAPTDERSGEPPAEQKLVRLTEFAQQRGSLDVLNQDETIDLRKSGQLKVATLPDDLK